MSKNRNTTKKDISTLTKAALNRYFIIDECLSNRYQRPDGWTVTELRVMITKKLRGYADTYVPEYYGSKGYPYDEDWFKSDVSISKRQIQKDLKDMEKLYDINIDFVEKGRLVRYYYEDSKFSIRNLPISSTEALHLQSVLSMLSRLKGLPQQEWINESIENLKKLYNVPDEKIIDFEVSSYSHVSDKLETFFGPLYEAITNKKVIAVKWNSFKDGECEAIIHPYLLKQYNHRWYLIGKSEKNNIKVENGFKGILNVPLDRMLQYSKDCLVGEAPGEVFEKYDLEDFYDDLIGVTFTLAGPQKVKLKVTDALKPYIVSKPLHESQTPVREDNTFTIIVHINYELKSLLRQHGKGIEVLEPLILREEMRKEYELLAEKHK